MKITIADIAKKANVSKMTVSRVINGETYVAKATKEKIEKIMEELNYQPNLIAKSLSSKKTLTLGVILQRTEDLFLDNYLAQVLSGITEVAQNNKYRITLLPVDRHEKTDNLYANFVRSRLVDGLILLNTKINDPAIDRLAEQDLPFIMVNHKKYKDKYNFIDTKNKTGAKLAVNHIYGKGYRRIAFLMGPNDETNSIDRLRGYKEAIEELGLEYKEEYVKGGDFSKDIADRATAELLKLDTPPDAIFCADDYMAIAAIDRIKKSGMKVPDDIGIVGFDDIEIGPYFRPPLTTIRQPILELGKQASKYLIKIINNEIEKPVHKLLDVELVVRESS